MAHDPPVEGFLLVVLVELVVKLNEVVMRLQGRGLRVSCPDDFSGIFVFFGVLLPVLRFGLLLLRRRLGRLHADYGFVLVFQLKAEGWREFLFHLVLAGVLWEFLQYLLKDKAEFELRLFVPHKLLLLLVLELQLRDQVRSVFNRLQRLLLDNLLIVAGMLIACLVGLVKVLLEEHLRFLELSKIAQLVICP